MGIDKSSTTTAYWAEYGIARSNYNPYIFNSLTLFNRHRVAVMYNKKQKQAKSFR